MCWRAGVFYFVPTWSPKSVEGKTCLPRVHLSNVLLLEKKIMCKDVFVALAVSMQFPNHPKEDSVERVLISREEDAGRELLWKTGTAVSPCKEVYQKYINEWMKSQTRLMWTWLSAFRLDHWHFNQFRGGMQPVVQSFTFWAEMFLTWI